MRIAEAQLVRAIGELSHTKSMGTAELSKAVKKFLIRRRLTKRTGKILRALELYEDEEKGQVVVQATTAHPLSPEAKRAVEEKVATLFGKEREKTQVVFHEDKAIIGGVKLETRDSRYDFSLGRSLDELRKSLSK